MRLRRLVQAVLPWLLALGVGLLVLALFRHYGWLRGNPYRKLAMMATATAICVPYFVGVHYFPQAIEATKTANRVRYEFRRYRYAVKFAAANNARLR
jgi:hypothetical protein